jgi:hypothetical protein
MTNYILSCRSPESVIQRIAKSSEQRPNGCRVWLGAHDRYGYGRFKLVTTDGKRQTGAHRAAWLSMVGDIQPGLVIDHLCRNRSCVNPDHMELVTTQVNTQRGDHSNNGRRLSPASGCAKHGFDHGRHRTRKDGYTRWDCQTCSADRVRKARCPGGPQGDSATAGVLMRL